MAAAHQYQRRNKWRISSSRGISMYENGSGVKAGVVKSVMAAAAMAARQLRWQIISNNNVSAAWRKRKYQRNIKRKYERRSQQSISIVVVVRVNVTSSS